MSICEKWEMDNTLIHEQSKENKTFILLPV